MLATLSYLSNARHNRCGSTGLVVLSAIIVFIVITGRNGLAQTEPAPVPRESTANERPTTSTLLLPESSNTKKTESVTANKSESVTTEKSASVTNQGEASVPSAIDRATISEIEGIRQMLGGGLSQELKAIDEILPPDDLSATDQFRQELKGVVTGANASETDQPKQDGHAGHSEQPQSLSSNTTRLETSDRTTTQQILRQCARHLEQSAGELEDIGDYQNADSLRQNAQTLWEKARTIR